MTTFFEFRHLKYSLGNLRKLSYFDDDGEFLVKAGLLEERVKAPSKIVLEKALLRSGVEDAEISRLGPVLSNSSTPDRNR